MKQILNNKKNLIFLIVSIFLLITIFFIALMVGRYTINANDFFHATFTGEIGFETERNVIVNLRLPRTIIACLSGISLSLSGLLYQEIFQNKLTSPDLLGVSNGSGFGAAISIVANVPSAFVSIFAFLFGLCTVFLTVFISKLFKNSKSTIFLISGVIVSAFMSSAIAFTKYLAKDEVQLSSITYWLMGSFANSSFHEVYILTPIILVCTVVILLFRWRINIVSLGRELAQTKGINYSFYRYAIIAISTLLTSSTVAFCGTISWVGLIIPHIVRLVSGRDTAKNVPLCITFGGIFMIFTDILSRSFTSQEIPLSAITGIFGGVIFIGILLSKRKVNYVI